jgi:voltage-gated potassium channel
MRVFLRRFLWALALSAGLVAAGTVGFLQFPGWTFSDALYMSVITLSAVGYQEVHELTDAGRALATALLAGGITMMGLWFALLTSAIVEMDLAHVFRIRRTMKKIGDLSDHFIVCGAGRTGRQVIRELMTAREPHVVVERDPEHAESFRGEYPESPVLEADATRDESLVEARIGTARGLVACLSGDTDNLFRVPECERSAAQPHHRRTGIRRADDAEAVRGWSRPRSESQSDGWKSHGRYAAPAAGGLVPGCRHSGEGLELRLEEVRVPSGSAIAGQKLSESKIPQKTGLIVIAARHLDDRGRDGPWVYNPGPEEEILPGDVLIVMGSADQIHMLHRTTGA